MVQNIFKGLGIALVTPFTSDGSVDYQSLSRLVEYQLKNGADFFCILATTGETPTLPPDKITSLSYFNIPLCLIISISSAYIQLQLSGLNPNFAI